MNPSIYSNDFYISFGKYIFTFLSYLINLYIDEKKKSFSYF